MKGGPVEEVNSTGRQHGKALQVWRACRVHERECPKQWSLLKIVREYRDEILSKFLQSKDFGYKYVLYGLPR